MLITEECHTLFQIIFYLSLFNFQRTYIIQFQEMQNTLKQLLVECLRDGHDDKVEMDPLKYPSQILSLAEAILVNI